MVRQDRRLSSAWHRSPDPAPSLSAMLAKHGCEGLSMDHYSWLSGPSRRAPGSRPFPAVRPASAELAEAQPTRTGRGGEPSLATVEALSQREREVLRYVPSVLSAAEIGAELYLSVNTVKTHLRSIYRKLGVNRRREAVIEAHRHGLL
jgi:DNA-binding CsgD family transcriptional regulator